VAIADASKITATTDTGIILGAYVGNVRPNSIAEKIGLVSGDIITQFNLKPITDAADLEQSLLKLNQGSHFSLSLMRGTRTMTKEGTF
jgi:S1-C subfamily serine protease